MDGREWERAANQPAALRLLEKDGRYRLSPLADACLVSSRPARTPALGADYGP